MPKIGYGGTDPNVAQRVGHSLIDRQVFTVSGTYTPTAGMRFVIVEVVGGGGGGGNSGTTANKGAGGGGGGGYVSKKILSGAIGVTETVTVGTGGATGAVGVTSSFGAHCTATGGAGGITGGTGTVGVAGGVGTSGDINASGGDGGAPNTADARGGAGGNSFYGSGGSGAQTDTVGATGSLYGGGGGGGSTTDITASNGGAGAAGIIIVWEYGDILVGSGPAANVILRNHIDGLIMSNGTDATNDIDIAAGVARDTANLRTMSLTTAITKQIDIDWAEGNNAGGFPAALTLTNDTWYHVFIIGKVDGTIDAGFDTSLTASNLLSDASAYTDYRRVGSVRRETATNMLFDQTGDHVVLRTAATIVSSTSIGTTRNVVSCKTPLGVQVVACLDIHLGNAATSTVVWIRPTCMADVAASTSNSNLFTSASGSLSNNTLCIMTDTSRNIAYRSSVSSVSNFLITQTAYIDFRGMQ